MAKLRLAAALTLLTAALAGAFAAPAEARKVPTWNPWCDFQYEACRLDFSQYECDCQYAACTGTGPFCG